MVNAIAALCGILVPLLLISIAGLLTLNLAYNNSEETGKDLRYKLNIVRDELDIEHARYKDLQKLCNDAYSVLYWSTKHSYPCDECKEHDCGNKCECACHNEAITSAKSAITRAMNLLPKNTENENDPY